MMPILAFRCFVSTFNTNNTGGNNVFFFFCCCSCTNGKIASSCQLCDGYCYNGGTCQLDPEINVPVCVWVSPNVGNLHKTMLHVGGVMILMFSFLGAIFFFKVGMSCISPVNCPSLTHVLHKPFLISFLKISWGIAHSVLSIISSQTSISFNLEMLGKLMWFYWPY